MTIHITHNTRILCHIQNGGMVFTVNFQEAVNIAPGEICDDCWRRYKNLCRMGGVEINPVKSEPEIPKKAS